MGPVSRAAGKAGRQDAREGHGGHPVSRAASSLQARDAVSHERDVHLLKLGILSQNIQVLGVCKSAVTFERVHLLKNV